MSFRIQPGQPEAGLTGFSPSSAAPANTNYGSAHCPDLAQAADLSARAEQLSGDLPMRQDRVDALRARIDAGSYHVNPQAVANAILQNFSGAEEEFVEDAAPCPIDRIRQSECLARGRCRCDRRHSASPPDSSDRWAPSEHPLAG